MTEHVSCTGPAATVAQTSVLTVLTTATVLWRQCGHRQHSGKAKLTGAEHYDREIQCHAHLLQAHIYTSAGVCKLREQTACPAGRSSSRLGHRPAPPAGTAGGSSSSRWPAPPMNIDVRSISRPAVQDGCTTAGPRGTGP